MEVVKVIWDFFQSEILGMKWLNRLMGYGLEALGIDVENRIGGSIHFFLYDVIKIMVLLGVLIATIAGIPMYADIFGCIPIAEALLAKGARLGVVLAFMMGVTTLSLPSIIMSKKIAFICVHNSCRSQIAEALGKHLAGDEFEFFSAGTETKPKINQDAVRIMKELYGIDMEQTQYSKTFDKIPTPDVVISMGCDVGCPYIGREFDDNWGLTDPTGQSDEVFKDIIGQIEERVLRLKEF